MASPLGQTLIAIGARSEADVAKMSADDIRNTIIVEINVRLGITVPVLQGMNDGDLNAKLRSIASPLGQTLLRIGGFTQVDLSKMSLDDVRNNAIVVANKRLNLDVPFLQGLSDQDINERLTRSIDLKAVPKAHPDASLDAKGYKRVAIGPLWDHKYACEKAREWVDNNDGFAFCGGWITTIPGLMSEIDVIDVRKVQSVEFANNEGAMCKFVGVGGTWTEFNKDGGAIFTFLEMTGCLHALYNHFCHPENPIKAGLPKSILDRFPNASAKGELKAAIVQADAEFLKTKAITLFDASRNVYLKLNLASREVFYGENDSSCPRKLYDIGAISA